jgi:hypothetical protein
MVLTHHYIELSFLPFFDNDSLSSLYNFRHSFLAVSVSFANANGNLAKHGYAISIAKNMGKPQEIRE